MTDSSLETNNKSNNMQFQKYAQIQSMEEDDRFFIKFFLLDDSLNLNQWKVTADAIKRDLQTFVGRPFVITNKFDHPTPDKEESERDGTITEVGFDENTGKAFGIAEIHNQEAIDLIKTGIVSFVSPSIEVEAGSFIITNGREIANKFKGRHVAGVKEPAFGKVKAQIKGQCNGAESTCMSRLHTVQAKTDILESNKANIKLFNIDRLKHFIAQNGCVESCLQKKSDEGITIDDQAVAICLNECGETQEGSGNQQFDLISSSINTENTKLGTMTDSNRHAQDECPEGQHKDESGNCVENARQAQEGCPEGQKMEDGTCVEAKLKDYGAKIANLQRENQELRAKLDREAKKTIVERIITAKISLGKVTDETKESETESLFKKDSETLTDLAKEYEAVVETKKQTEGTPFVRYKTASVQKGSSNDELVASYKRLTA